MGDLEPLLINPYLELFELLQNQPIDCQLAARKKLVWAYSWAIPTAEVALKIKELGPLVEVGAGTGYWAWILRQAGAQIQCLDQESQAVPRWVDLRQGGPPELKEFPDHTLLLCWPPLNTGMATQCLKEFLGSRLVYVGEWKGRTAEPEFHEQLEKHWRLDRQMSIPCWPGYSDQVFLFSRV